MNNNEVPTSLSNMTLVGKITARCPIYVLNLKYKSKDKDPFYPIDKVILQALYDYPKTNISYLSWLVGFEPDIIESRIQYHLLKDGFIMIDATNNYVVTESGERKYLTTGSERPDVEVTGAVMVDGTNLRVWPQLFYDKNFYISYRQGKTTTPHCPLMGIEDPVVTKAVKGLENAISGSEFSYGLEDDAHSLEVISYDERYINDIEIELWADDNGNVIKREVYKGQTVNIPALKGTYQNYYFYFSKGGVLHHNEGTTDDIEAGKTVYVDTYNDLWIFLANLYKIKKSDTALIEQTITYNKAKPEVKVSKQLLQEAGSKRSLLADTEQGYVKTPAVEGGIMYITITPLESIKPILEFDEAFGKWEEEKGEPDMDFVRSLKGELSKNWREAFCLTGRFESLEKIDRQQFFKFE